MYNEYHNVLNLPTYYKRNEQLVTRQNGAQSERKLRLLMPCYTTKPLIKGSNREYVHSCYVMAVE